MGTSIIRLFSGGRRLAHFWNSLEIELHDACDRELTRDPSLHQGSLFLRLRDRFTLYPVSLGNLDEVTIRSRPSKLTRNGVTETGFRASARVPFSGSKVLLQSQPEPDYRFGFSGQVTKHALKLHAALPDMDARSFVAEVTAELDRIKPVLAAFESTVREYDDQLRKRIEDKISTI